MADSFGQCAICKNDLISTTLNGLNPQCHCPRCGTFEYDSEVGWLDVISSEHMVRLSGWIREQNDAGIIYPNITMPISRRISKMKIPSLRERANRALLSFTKHYPDINRPRNSKDFTFSLDLQGRSYSLDEDSAHVLMVLLSEEGYIFLNSFSVVMSIKGLLAVEALEAKNLESAQGFVAMSFSSTLYDAWTNGFDPAIRLVGFVPLRIDAKDYVGGISDEIISEIRRSRFVIVDYTKQANGVYFEAGFALGLGLTIIPTCRDDEIGNLHFDIRHLNTLAWKDPQDLLSKLPNRITAAIGSIYS